jgi:hypothetical protein
MPIFVTDPIIRLLTPNGPRTVGLHEVFAHAHNGSLTDLSALIRSARACCYSLGDNLASSASLLSVTIN